MSRARGYATAAMTTAAGFLGGSAIRDALHHAHRWLFGSSQPYFSDPDYRRHERQARKLYRQGRLNEAGREMQKSTAAYKMAHRAYRVEQAAQMARSRGR